MGRNLMTATGGRCILKPPLFDGTNYIDWKEDMKIFIKSVDFTLWVIIKNGPNIPSIDMDGTVVETSEDAFNDEDINNVEQDSRAKHILCCAVNSEAYREISRLRTAKEMWDHLANSHGNINHVESSSPSRRTYQSAVASSDMQSYHSAANSEHPSLVFLEETREAMNGYLNKCVPLYKYALQGNWKEAKVIIESDPRLKNAALASGFPTVLHISAGAGGGKKHVRFVKQLMREFLSGEDLLLRDYNGNTAFCFAAAAGNLQVVESMLGKNPSVVEARGANGASLPVQFAALQGRYEMAWFLYEMTMFRDNDELEQLFLTCINTGLYDLALKMAIDHPGLAFATDENGETALHLLARNHLDSCCQSPQHKMPPIKINPAMKQKVVFQLVKKLWSTILEEKCSKREIIDIISEPFQVLFAAVEVGNFGFLSELISAYPSLIWERDDRDQQTIIHKAVRNRHASIFNLIHEIGSQKDIIVTIEDNKGNTLLHLAAQRAPQSQLELVYGAAFKMCLELVWFEEVKKIMPPSLINSKNLEGLTASELFTHEHTELRKDAESWMKSTAENCMLVATVIATGVFAAATNIPDGSFDDKSAFLVFAISDAAAFITSVAAMLIFLSILVSRYAEYDFYRSLPLKLIFGLVALFCSITSMMVAFASAFFITYYNNGSNRVAIFISVSAILPILLFLILQSSLWSDIMYSTVYCRNLFKPGKNMLYILQN